MYEDQYGEKKKKIYMWILGLKGLIGLTVHISWDFTTEKFELFLWSPFRNENFDYAMDKQTFFPTKL